MEKKKMLTAKDGFRMIGKGMAVLILSLLRGVREIMRWMILGVIEVVSFVYRTPKVIIALLMVVIAGMIFAYADVKTRLETKCYQCYQLEYKLDSMEMKSFKYTK